MKKLLIMGDSLSFNRYGYDEVPRSNSYDCFPDMRSWSFCLRDELIKKVSGFVFGVDLAKSKESFDHTVFGEKAFCGSESQQFLYKAKTNTITLYLQKHPEGKEYKIDIDDGFSSYKVDFKGDVEQYQARAIFYVTLPANPALETHKISFEGNGAYTVLGIAKEDIEINISGKGSQKVDFFLENFDERVKKFEFDTILCILGANDINRTPLEEFEENYSLLIKKILEINTNVKMTLLLPTDLSDPNNPNVDSDMYCSKKTASLYTDIICKIAKKHNFKLFNTWELFENIPFEKWRYDEVHLSNLGNQMLFEKMLKMINE